MKLALIDELERPCHPRELGEVQEAHATSQAAHAAAIEAQRRHEDNHRILNTSSDDVERWRSQAAAGNLLSEMLRTKAAAREASVNYQTLYDQGMAPVKQFWHHELQKAVLALCEELGGKVCERNAEVLRIIADASDDGVTLPAGCTLEVLAPASIQFVVACLRREAGLQ